MQVTYVYVSYISHKFIDSPIKGPQGHIQYEHDLLQLYYNITSNENKKTVHGKKEKKKKKNPTALTFSPLV